jgi:hypothetical protein
MLPQKEKKLAYNLLAFFFHQTSADIITLKSNIDARDYALHSDDYCTFYEVCHSRSH